MSGFKARWITVKYFLAALVVLFSISCSTAHAADVHDGIWKIDRIHSEWSDGNFPKNMSLSLSLQFTTDSLVYHSLNDTNGGKGVTSDFTARFDGKTYQLAGQTRYNQVSVRKMGPDQYEILEYKDGDVIVGAFWQFSADGKHLMRWGIGKSPEGKSKAYTEYFDKQ
jgi:hypothetical protein